MIYKKFYGDVVLAKIDEDQLEKLGDYSKSEDTGLYIPKDKVAKEDGYRLATVLEVSEELKEMYSTDDRVMIPSIGREKSYSIKGEVYYRIPKQDILGVISEDFE